MTIQFLRNIAFKDAYNPDKLPLKRDGFHEQKENLCIVYPLYIQNGRTDLIEDILHQYDLFSDEILEHLEIVLVDDCSPNVEKLIDISKYKVKISLLRILDDLKWNSGGAKNLGVFYSSSKRIITTDIDHFFPERTCAWAMTTHMKEGEVCHFKRVMGKTVRKTNAHPNTFLMTRNTYIRLHGYDEDFVGMYGDDIFFRKYLKKNARRITISPQECIVYDINRTAHSLSRKLSMRFYLLLLLKGYHHSKRMLRFRWRYLGTNTKI